MTADLLARARATGIATRFKDMDGAEVTVPPETIAALLEAFGVTEDPPVPPEDPGEVMPVAPPGVRCFVPPWLRRGRAWGLAAQLYAVRSARNHGIGDFRDLADLCRRAAPLGADFVGVNPLHALFLSAPERASPFSPSSRRFLNPLYIALEDVPGHDPGDVDPAAVEAARGTDAVDYAAVAAVKVRALRLAFARFEAGEVADAAAAADRFARFREARGAPLSDHALFEALSERMVADGHGAGWADWPAAFHDRHGAAVEAFARENDRAVTFHAWLQWLAHEQLAAAQAAARAAGMRVGVYLDLAVGTAPDGSATWSDPHLVLPSARVGAPPDLFSVRGQDWGLAPFSPPELVARDLAPFREMLEANAAPAGALRIDHAMGLFRIYLIPDGATSETGTYVFMPMPEIVRILAEVSRKARCIVIGEDLGLVPEGFRDAMARAEIQSYRIAWFEKEDGRFVPPSRYPRAALACLSTHDLPALHGWWRGVEIDLREGLAMIDADKAEAERAERAADRRALLTALRRQRLLPEGASAKDEAPDAALAAAVHAFVARARSRLFAVRLEDLSGEDALVNLPGTDREHPNWRRKLPRPVEDLLERPLAVAILEAVRQERPK